MLSLILILTLSLAITAIILIGNFLYANLYKCYLSTEHLNSSEKIFYKKLQDLNSNHYVLCKVELHDIAKIAGHKGLSDFLFKETRDEISHKTVDFMILDENKSVILAINIDNDSVIEKSSFENALDLLLADLSIKLFRYDKYSVELNEIEDYLKDE